MVNSRLLPAATDWSCLMVAVGEHVCEEDDVAPGLQLKSDRDGEEVCRITSAGIDSGKQLMGLNFIPVQTCPASRASFPPSLQQSSADLSGQQSLLPSFL
ncbi:hypothetical protein NQZ68_025283 [Dissostichus eleginoides]|nr:hypothetical protein NQZ68_025283 [Dissostichus eleginoides]